MIHHDAHNSMPMNNHRLLSTSTPGDQKSSVVSEKPAHCRPLVNPFVSSSGIDRSMQMTMCEQARGPSANSMRATSLQVMLVHM